MVDAMATVVPVILAGGSGTRLWPLSRKDRPKQFLPIAGEETLIQRSVRRALAITAPDRLLTVADEDHFFLVQDNLGAIDPGTLNGILLEPHGRNTAAALAYAALVAEERWPGALLWMMPADHVIKDEAALHGAVERARPAAEQGWIVTFGIEPDRPETGFGYIKRGQPIAGADGAFAVARFVEKPPLADAQDMIADDHFLWNSGMLLTSARTFLDELARHAPGIHQGVRDTLAARKPAPPFRIDGDRYLAVPSEPFDKAVLERSDKVAVLPCDIGWCDVGAWNNLWELQPHDDDDNVIEGPVVADRTSNCLVYATGRLVACTGLRDLAIVETRDAVLVADRTDAAGVRRLLRMLNDERRPEIADGSSGRWAWGRHRTLHDDPDLRIRELIVHPGGVLEGETHRRHQQHWLVTCGTARATCGDHVRDLVPGCGMPIPARTWHRLENRGDKPLHVIEIRRVDHAGDGDVVHLDALDERVRAAS